MSKRPRDDVDDSAPANGSASEPPVPALVGSLVFPGDELCTVSFLATKTKLVLGGGVVRDGDSLHSCRLGMLRYAPPPANKLWVEGEAKRYVPSLGDHVIGVVQSTHAEEYKLHIGAAHAATLPVLAFDGATRRNRPHLEVGALVYARVTVAHRDMEPECSCAAPLGIGAKDWVTKESVFGELSGGHAFDCPPLLCKRLSPPADEADEDEDASAPVLEALGARFAYELAVGANGRVWLSSAQGAQSVLAQAAILQSQGVADAEHEALVEQLVETFGLADELGGRATDAAAAAAAADAFMQSLGGANGAAGGGS